MNEKKTTRRTMPLWIGLLCFVLAVSSFTFTTFAVLTSFEVFLPGLGEIQFQTPSIMVESMGETYNSSSQRYIQWNIGLKNYDSIEHTASLKIIFYGIGGIEVATGMQTTGPVAAGQTVGITVPINWNLDYTIANLTRANWQIIQLS